MQKEQLIAKFQELYGEGGEIRTYFAPGRVNLIGEHTDYNGGHVFPCALTMGTWAVVRNRADRKLGFFSLNFEKLGIIETSLDELIPNKEAGWTNYPKGVMWAFEKRGYELTHGMDILIYGNIPNGSGLSSSASLEVLTGLMLKDTFGFEDISMIDLALIGQYSENNFNGCNCGIMDQFASAMGKKDHAIFLDTNTLKYEYAPVVLENAKIVIINSKVKHSLVDSAYNDRRNECETALKELQSRFESEKKLRTEVMTEAFTKGLSMVSFTQDKLNVALADLGSRYNRLELTEDKLDDQSTNTEEKLSDNEDVDLTDAYINMTQADNLYQASLSATVKILGTSLLNYI